MHRPRRLIAAGAVGAAAVATWLYVRADDGARTEAAEAAERRSSSRSAATCAHPFVPLASGTMWRYRVSTSIEQPEATVTGRVLSGGRVRWESEAPSPARPMQWTIRVRCGPDGVEEPWFGLLEGMLGVLSRSTDAASEPTAVDVDVRRWLVPRELAAGTTFGGEARLKQTFGDESVTLTIERNYRIESRELTRLFDGREAMAWRARFTERQVAGAHEGSWEGEAWLVEAVGLARLEVYLADHRITWDLVAHRSPTSPHEP